MREGHLCAGAQVGGTCQWTCQIGKIFSIRFEIDTFDRDDPFVRLYYSWVWASSPEAQSADYCVRLTTTRPRFGGPRWWFTCPLFVGGRPCERRVGKLHLPPDARHFGCRQCHELTYTSCQEHDGRVSALRRNPELLSAILDNLKGASVSQLALALKALRPRRL
jgi:hypothetical protein